MLASIYHRCHWQAGRVLAVAVALALASPSIVGPARAETDPWPSLRSELFQSRDIADEDGAVLLFAPAQAEDAAVVPISIRLPANVEAQARKLTLLIDRNPAPVAAVITFGPAYAADGALGERRIETRVRVDSFSKVRAVLETKDGKLHMAAKFVAGAGGCSAAASKDMDEAIASMGRMRVQVSGEANRTPDWREAVVMIRHPSFTGMQKDPRTGDFTPAWFIRQLEISRGPESLMKIESGISIAENPHYRVNFRAAGDAQVQVRAVDTKEAVFEGSSAGS